MPFTTVYAGQVITASWGNSVRDQLVTPFSSATDRSSQITAIGGTVPEGFPSYLTDGDDFWLATSTTVHKPFAGPPAACKQADETVNNTAVLQNDDDLAIAVVPGYYIGELWLGFTANAAAGLKVDFTAPAGSTMRCSGYLAIIAGVTTLGTTGALGSAFLSATGAQIPYMNKFTLHTTNSGTLQLRWAQNAAHASNCTVHQGSYLRLLRVI